MNKTAGIVLCGGKSSRMGESKAWLPFAGEPMLCRVVRLLGEAVSPVVVVAGPEQDLPALPTGVAIVRDRVGDRGPLHGLAAGLEALIGLASAAYLSSCDVPFLQPAFVLRMAELLGDQQIAAPEVGGFRHPLAAVYRIEVLDLVRRLLEDERHGPASLFNLVPTRFVSAAELGAVDPELHSLRNVNTAEEYEAALRDSVQDQRTQTGLRPQSDSDHENTKTRS